MISHNILLSLDYELYFTRNSTEESVLIEPTKVLLESANKMGVKLTIFVDTLCLFRYLEMGNSKFVKKVEDQLKSAIQRGHDVQIHLHPHWLTAQLHEKTWTYETDQFLLGKLGRSDQEVYEITKTLLLKSKDYLQSLLTTIDSKYVANSFRAGGYGIQPKEKMILKALIDTNIKIDSSIVPNMFLQTLRNQIDFRSTPNKANYFLNWETGIEKEAQTGVWEVPIAAGKVSPLSILKRLARYSKNQCFPDKTLFGKGSSQDLKNGAAAVTGSLKQSMLRKLKILHDRHASLHIPEDSRVLVDLTKSWVNRFAETPTSTSLLLHPKGLTQQMVNDFESYISKLKVSKTPFNFPTFLELSEKLNGGIK